VPRIEGSLVELSDWEPKPLVCDNNLLACSRRHFDRVIDRLKLLAGIDFNQGLDARLLTPRHVDLLRSLDTPTLRFSFEHISQEDDLRRAISLVTGAGFTTRRITVYVLIGFDDTPADALYRLQTVKALGIRPFPQRYQPLDALVKNNYVAPSWTRAELLKMVHYWARQRWFEHIPYDDYVRR